MSKNERNLELKRSMGLVVGPKPDFKITHIGWTEEYGKARRRKINLTVERNGRKAEMRRLTGRQVNSYGYMIGRCIEHLVFLPASTNETRKKWAEALGAAVQASGGIKE